ncbi:MAG: MBL fold metallo-hydrolase [Oscillospiraceae bacterium]|nr:MBL fold metallo-hydrolase [Oscillospiraceae bacterium]
MSVKESVFKLEEGLFRIVETEESGRFVDSYLIEGKRTALLIDTQRCENDLREVVRDLTDKPLEIVITHAHPDHLGPATEDFLREGIPVWVFREEIELYAPFGAAALPIRFDKEYGLRDLSEGQVFDLGGYELEIRSLGGHTPRAAMLIERKKGWLFSGDAMGNRSFYMQVDGACSLESFSVQMDDFLDIIKKIPDLKIYTGHGIGTESRDLAWAEAVREATEQILDGSCAGVPTESPWPNTLRMETPVFPDGYLYRSDNIR